VASLFWVFSLAAPSGGRTGSGLPWLLLALEERLLPDLELDVDILQRCFAQPVNCRIIECVYYYLDGEGEEHGTRKLHAPVPTPPLKMIQFTILAVNFL
jgi:hypothetical protein